MWMAQKGNLYRGAACVHQCAPQLHLCVISASPPTHLIVQTGIPMTGLAVVGAQWRLTSEERGRLYRLYLPWAWRAGSKAKDLMTVFYEEHLEVCGPA